MAIRTQAVTPFNNSQGPSTGHDSGSGPTRIKIKSNMSKARMSGVDDPLHAALAAKTLLLPRDEHTWRHSKHVQPRGAHYSPAGEFGSRHRTGAGRGVYSYGKNRHSAVPGNAVGSPPNRRGGNALV